MMKKISDAPALVGSIFHLAVSGKQILPWPLTEVIDKVLFQRVKSATGGRLRLAVCGGEHLIIMVS
jgi:long-chain acyl-CoA synthetase